MYDPGNVDNLESSDSESDHEHLSEVNDESSGDDDVPLAQIYWPVPQREKPRQSIHGEKKIS